MDKLTFGATLVIVGMGGTMLTLYLITLLIRGMTYLLRTRTATPPKPE